MVVLIAHLSVAVSLIFNDGDGSETWERVAAVLLNTELSPNIRIRAAILTLTKSTYSIFAAVVNLLIQDPLNERHYPVKWHTAKNLCQLKLYTTVSNYSILIQRMHMYKCVLV
ncbi:hypothetical protein F4703DRAFT_1797957 [Phycomyces blakesleeanus]|uniref:Uncharacterized protein n=1 Tax=Phycomyces blakesleeanus (strain ATCC 8743b / DSM 1359 / FGSC 10004 / NBRC 33097 / NRRL 1555) TaxID=763407 RepID=A0A162WDZ9_PHYB8|nr:hypothetical protein PHYBLDRAFT_70891 [Phycomyces blakesleeanus NRRL 1555(-)]OAD66435.1 hypothetical protein PHYBLDRAFT_70891 [Phycomyces blakesleeanus NRRL 1555(-)]|eukprot:XP_018284475.1 hypothetical protein PHYBLDRAFT_70891 [Phycomyces blakesleeanus NRRL 1555(-)]